MRIDTVFTGGRVVTLDERRPTASGVPPPSGVGCLTGPGVGTIDGIGKQPAGRARLPARARAGRPRRTRHGDAVPHQLDLGVRTGLGDEWLRLGPVKILADGSLIGRSAAMHECYAGEPDNKGFMQFEPAELREVLLGARRAGWWVAAHAIGDVAVDHVLDVIEQANGDSTPKPGRRRIEHFAVTSEAQVRRAAGLGRLADFVVLSDELLSVDPSRIRELTVGATVVGGEVGTTTGRCGSGDRPAT